MQWLSQIVESETGVDEQTARKKCMKREYYLHRAAFCVLARNLSIPIRSISQFVNRDRATIYHYYKTASYDKELITIINKIKQKP